MNTHNSPENILSEILNRDPNTTPLSPTHPPKFDLPPPEDAFSNAVEKKDAPGWVSLLLPWLCIILGAALLILGICLLQVVRINAQMDELQQSMEDMQTIGQLREENEALQNAVQEALDAQQEAELDSQAQRDLADKISQNLNIATVQKWRSDYLFYIGQFMEHGDYPMAAMVIALSADRYLAAVSYFDDAVLINPAQAEQYQSYRQELIDRGYLQELFVYKIFPEHESPSGSIFLPEQWSPSINPDMAALGILWCALDEYYIRGNDNAAAQYLYLYPLGDPASGYQERLEHQASNFTLKQFQILKITLSKSGFLHVSDDGALGEGSAVHTMERYTLPFNLPE